MNPTPSLRPASLCLHAGFRHDLESAGVCSPIITSTAYGFPNGSGENVYPRYFNVPNQRVVSEKVAALEQAEDGLVFGSGMAAISTFLVTFLQAGDHAVFQADLYGGTRHFIDGELRRRGVTVSFARTAEDFAAARQPNTKLIYLESPSNPLLQCVDLAAVASLAQSHGILSAIDNTFATPINQTPIALGMNVVLHSATKYLNGHSDLNAGVVVSSKATIDTLREGAMNFGGMLDSQACALLERGLKTLALRVRQHNENASRLAEYLDAHPAVACVHYPGLPSHPDHAIAARQMSGFGGMLSFELRDADAVDGFLKRLMLITPALSLGGVESLICVPSRTSHRSLSAEERGRVGISEGLIRLSVGIEALEDLQTDLDQALSRD